MLDLGLDEIQAKPFPHVIKDEFLPLELYTALCMSFPECPANSGPTGFSFFWGDPEYDALVAQNPAWKTLFQFTQSQAFVDYCLRQFGEMLLRGGCTIDLSRARYVAFQESRADKERRHLRDRIHEPHELWVRTDILQGRIGYSRQAHLDHRRRLLALLIYCCDADDNQMIGGELVLHETNGRGSGEVVVKPRHNRMIGFACGNDSYHSVPLIRALSAPRNFIQISLSSSVDAWPDDSTALDKLKAALRSVLPARGGTVAHGN